MPDKELILTGLVSDAYCAKITGVMIAATRAFVALLNRIELSAPGAALVELGPASKFASTCAGVSGLL